ncbi:MAG TPA: hypothetical protein PLJ62_01215, partial [Thermoflexales bacterium]|nr:hypothetical protein [Thermoflexales bacterium]
SVALALHQRSRPLRIVTPSASHASFVGMNPQLGDRAPFAVLGDDPDSASRVLAAAKAFVVSG